MTVLSKLFKANQNTWTPYISNYSNKTQVLYLCRYDYRNELSTMIVTTQCDLTDSAA